MRNYRIIVGAVILLCFFWLFMVQEGWTLIGSGEMKKEAYTKVVETYLKLPLDFIKNEGQVDENVKFYEKGSRHSTFFTEQGIYLTLRDSKETATVRLTFVNGKGSPEIVGEDILGRKVNYFIGNDKKRWRTNISTYKAVRYRSIYENVDIKFYGNNRQLEYDIVVKPGADPSAVKFSYEGIDGLTVTEQGELSVNVKGNRLIHKKPHIYQDIDGKRVEIEGAFKIYDKQTYGFQVASYNMENSLIIDPVLVYSTYLGRSEDDLAYSIAVDGSRNTYVTGCTRSLSFPTKEPFQPNNAGSWDVFVTKINASGDALVYSTYLGGSQVDEAFSIAVDGSGNAYVTGDTSSTDFPTKNPLQTNHGADLFDAFVTKINASGELDYSTYLGGSKSDVGSGIAVDGSGNAYVTGRTFSLDFPTKNPLQPNLSGQGDVFVAKINASGSALVYSTYLGGSDYDYAYGIAVDSSGNAYVTGDTFSTDFPTKNPLQSNNSGLYDAFVTKINASGSALVYSTYLGGTHEDHGYGVAVDGSGNAYLVGWTYITDFPTKDPLQQNNGGSWDAFVTKINASGDALVYSTYLGGTEVDVGSDIAVDGSGNAYVTGWTYSYDFPTKDPLQQNLSGQADVFVAKIVNPVSPTSYDFGSVNVGSSSTPQAFTISNTGTGDQRWPGLFRQPEAVFK